MLFGPNGTYGKENLSLLRGEIEIPQEIKEVKTAKGLKPFLGDSHELTRMAAVKRLGEIGGFDSVDYLYDTFLKEPYKGGFESSPIVKIEIIRSLQKIGREKAKSVLFNILSSYLKKGPQVTEKIIYYDGDCLGVVIYSTEALFQLYNPKDDSNIYELFKNIALSGGERKQ